MAVDADGYWTVDGVRIKDAAGNDVKAAGSNGKDGDSFFESVTDGDDEVTFTLTDGTTIIIPKASAAGFAFVFPTQLPKGGTDVDNYYLFAFGEEKILAYTGDITTADLMSIPQGWAARIDPDKKTVTVTARRSRVHTIRRVSFRSSASTAKGKPNLHPHASALWIIPIPKARSYSTRATCRRITGRSSISQPTAV